MSRRSPARSDALTGDLFSTIPKPWTADAGTMDFRPRVAALLGQMLAEAAAANPEHDRYWIAARVSRLVGKEVSKAMLDGYTAESREAFNLPFWLVSAIEHVCASTLLTDWHAEMRGGRFLPGAEAIDAEIGRSQRLIEQERDRQRLLRDLRRRLP
jgi:hypothetical protein